MENGVLSEETRNLRTAGDVIQVKGELVTDRFETFIYIYCVHLSNFLTIHRFCLSKSSVVICGALSAGKLGLAKGL